MNDPACQQMNLIAPSEGAEPGDYELTYPVYDIDDCRLAMTAMVRSPS